MRVFLTVSRIISTKKHKAMMHIMAFSKRQSHMAVLLCFKSARWWYRDAQGGGLRVWGPVRHW